MTASFVTLPADPSGVAAPYGRLRVVSGTFTGSTSYTTGGDTITAASLGFAESILQLYPFADGSAYFPVWTGTKLKAFSDFNTEVTSTTDIHTSVFPFFAVGF